MFDSLGHTCLQEGVTLTLAVSHQAEGERIFTGDSNLRVGTIRQPASSSSQPYLFGNDLASVQSKVNCLYNVPIATWFLAFGSYRVKGKKSSRKLIKLGQAKEHDVKDRIEESLSGLSSIRCCLQGPIGSLYSSPPLSTSLGTKRGHASNSPFRITPEEAAVGGILHAACAPRRADMLAFTRFAIKFARPEHVGTIKKIATNS